MGYLHRWDLKDKQLFNSKFLEEVMIVINDYQDILKDIMVNEEYISFNGKKGYGCETFIFHHKNYYNSVKTGTFSVAAYDVVVSSILLLAKVHFRDKLELNCDGLSTLFINIETKQVSSQWEEAIIYVKETFGYTFDRTHILDEYDQDVIKLTQKTD
jgi:hypothetical protein